ASLPPCPKFRLPPRVPLHEKARRFEALMKMHLRQGTVLYIDDLRERGAERFGGYADSALWTGCYLGAEAFRYAVSRGAERELALERVLELLRGLRTLQRITGKKGLLARSFIRADREPPRMGRKARRGKGPFSNYFWKGDASRDQYDGVLFGYAIAHDLVPEGRVSALVKEDLRLLAEHILENNWKLVDVDGRATRHGELRAWGLNGLNALLSLTFMKIAHRVTGDGKFRQAYESLIFWNYPEIAFIPFVRGLCLANYSNDNMAFLAFYNLLRLEGSPELQAHYQAALGRAWEVVREDGNALFNFIYLATFRGRADPEAKGAALRSLREMPLERRNCEIINSRRKDVKLSLCAYRGRPQLRRALPIYKRPLSAFEWKSNPYRSDGGDSHGRGQSPPVDYLLAYWMGRYHGFIDGGL
ncbi:MAG: hypothetical protein ACE5LX_04895, partial [Nitrospinota bacterium]